VVPVPDWSQWVRAAVPSESVVAPRVLRQLRAELTPPQVLLRAEWLLLAPIRPPEVPSPLPA
jgi:hypothetical protein